jgi:hypothetical protein
MKRKGIAATKSGITDGTCSGVHQIRSRDDLAVIELTRSGPRRSGLSSGDRVSERLLDVPPESRNSERACRFQGEAWHPA